MIMTKAILKTELFRIIDIVRKIDNYLYLTQYMETISSEEKQETVQSIAFLDFSLFTYKYVLIIEIDKLIRNSNTHKLNLHKFLQKIETNCFFRISGKEKIKIHNLQELINSENFVIFSTKVSTIRDKYFAHTDRIQPEIGMPTLNEIEKVFNDIKKILKELASIFFNSEIHFPTNDIFEISTVLRLFTENTDSFSTRREI